jgi:hypothetical protein
MADANEPNAPVAGYVPTHLSPAFLCSADQILDRTQIGIGIALAINLTIGVSVDGRTRVT